MPPDPVRTSGYCIDDSRRRDIVVDTSHKMQYNLRKKRKVSPAVNALANRRVEARSVLTVSELEQPLSTVAEGQPPTLCPLPPRAAKTGGTNKKPPAGVFTVQATRKMEW